MNDGVYVLVQNLALGGMLGLIYFGGLWLTLRRIAGSGNPALLALTSFLLRSAVCILGFYLAMGYGLEGLAACLCGFILMKLALILQLSRRTGLNGHADP